MRLSLPLDYAGDPRQAADDVAALEAAGLDAVWLAGPANVRMTAELADGWLPTLFIPERARQVWGTPLAEGAARRDKEAEAAVPDEFCELISLCGPEGYVRERVEAFREAGVTMLNVIPVGPEPARLVETVKGWL
ncbi:hypothetical protein C4B68_04980 [Streptomyces dengpaensis]|uniref:LLM class flavin-dependent oxidoreductase n=1 Tax=Streptomyces dengpaensis TaxID=2049881 RepID=A0ABN5HXG3_9ACTN|nr:MULTISPECIES: hypothetical protein [Streptomyces]AVH55253.1 hypothetical protein C4B68_04980 [Streptomyces dengpaensis]PIB07378.1 hypothetical protein B1C81_19850 [Streptomyces sp. HG99]